jgi:hypothetical protein
MLPKKPLNRLGIPKYKRPKTSSKELLEIFPKWKSVKIFS